MATAIVVSSPTEIRSPKKTLKIQPAARKHKHKAPLPSIVPGKSLSIRRTISPVFGALSIRSFNPALASSTLAAQNASYYFNVIMEAMDPNHASAWFAAFVQFPLVYHVLSYAAGTHQDLSNHSNTVVNQQQTLMHKIRTIKLVNELLSDVTSTSLTDSTVPDPLILAISVLWHLNQKQATESDKVEAHSLFSPHIPSSNSPGSLGSVESIDDHANALYHLVKRAGGLENLKLLPNLGSSLGIADLLAASSEGTKPRLPMPWNFIDLDNSAKEIDEMLGQFLGIGFFIHVPGGLSGNSLVMFRRLCAIDRVLDEMRCGHRQVGPADYMAVMLTRNAVQHQLLSLPSWSELDEQDREGYLEVSYEACRLTAVLYSNSVLFPLAPSRPCHAKNLKALRGLLEGWDGALLRHGKARRMMLWVLVIGGIAAFETEHGTFFLEFLREVVEKHECTWGSVRDDLGRFLWADSSCGDGLATLWQTMGLPWE